MQIKSTMHEDRMAIVIKGNAPVYWNLWLTSNNHFLVFPLPPSPSLVSFVYIIFKKN